ncbi:kinase anchor protein [Halarchaeum acidiphilum]|uniref:kinase anchor protein n=1 Tax=Halarchaeum acidiphilum TaxID=489138 RepID=UPI0006778336|nr:kinase anchor protein [Halarchaeum acidiphilum]
MSDYLAAADSELDAALDDPMTLAEYAERVVDHPLAAAHASKYLLAAVDSYGTRTVVEEGEERVRYRFFDDPANDGAHAVLGNTDVLNAFVADLRAIAAGRAKTEKICWFSGPTATGKSEFKRCLIDGLRAFSRTEAGRRYTIEWNVTATGGGDALTYGEARPERETDWYESPVQANPLSAFPPAVRERVLADAASNADGVAPRVETALDPFSREAYDRLAERYRGRAGDGLFSAVTDPDHCRVTNYVVDVGRGIGVLHAEDAGSPKERLVGSWMPEMLSRLDSRGRKNPQAFSYDGVLSQGNGGLTVVEDASQHADLLRKLLNVPDERRVKLDTAIGMDVDTQLLVISNPDLEAQLDQHAEATQADPLKALKRRLDRHEFRYLTNYGLETQLLRRELLDETGVWGDADRATVEERVAAGARVSVRDDDGTETVELAPHALEAAAVYSVVTRLDADALPADLDLVDTAVLYDRGYLREGGEKRTREDFDLDGGGDGDGEAGVPVTYTRDVLAELLAAPPARGRGDAETDADADADAAAVVTPDDVLDAMASGLSAAPVFSTGEAAEYEERVVAAKDYAFAAQEDDVLAALTHDVAVDEATVAEYVEGVYAWATDGTVETPRGEEPPDPLALKVFETEHLGRFDEGHYDGTEPTESVREFRESKVVTALNRHAWEHRDEAFRAGDVDLAEIPAVTAVLDATDWDDVRRRYPEFEPHLWTDPPAETRTAELKAKAIDYLASERGYTRVSAELATTTVVEGVRHRWD